MLSRLWRSGQAWMHLGAHRMQSGNRRGRYGRNSDWRGSNGGGSIANVLSARDQGNKVQLHCDEYRPFINALFNSTSNTCLRCGGLRHSMCMINGGCIDALDTTAPASHEGLPSSLELPLQQNFEPQSIFGRGMLSSLWCTEVLDKAGDAFSFQSLSETERKRLVLSELEGSKS